MQEFCVFREENKIFFNMDFLQTTDQRGTLTNFQCLLLSRNFQFLTFQSQNAA